MDSYKGLHNQLQANKLPSFALFAASAVIGFLFLNSPNANQQSLPYEFELSGAVHSVISLDDSSLVAAGDFSRLVKIGKDGHYDEEFGGYNNEGFNHPVRSLASTQDGGFVVGGDFTAYNQDIVGYFAKLDHRGQVDSHFAVQSGIGFDDTVHKVLALKNGHFVVAGKFETYNGFEAPHLAEIDSEGRLVRHFHVDGPVHSLSLASENEVAIGGDFSHVGDNKAHSFAVISLGEAL